MSPPRKGQRGVTLLELMVVGVILLIVVAGLSKLIKQTFQGLSLTEKSMVLQRDLLRAQDVIQRDFLSAGRSSFMNLLPDPGFESLALLPSVPTSASWGAVPVSVDPIEPTHTVYANITASTASFGMGSLCITSFGDPYAVESPTLNGLLSGQAYMVSGWISQKIGSPPLRAAGIQVIKNGDLLLERTVSANPWTRVSMVFTAEAGAVYSVRLNALVDSNSPNRVASFFFDNVTLTPLAIVLLPGDHQSFEFQRRDARTGNYVRLRYSLEPDRGSGKLVRQQWDGAVWQPLDPDIPNIRRLSVEWQNGAADAAFGTDRPIDIVVEAGAVSGVGKSLSAQFSISLGAL